MPQTPSHIAIIMDGNRRWAEKKGLPHIMGHTEGVKSIDTITEECASRGIKALTLYGFSSENWSRPQAAVADLFGLMKTSLEKNLIKVRDNNIRLRTIGRKADLPGSLRETLDKAVIETDKNTGMVLTVALNYGGRLEIVDAVNRSLEGSEGKILVTEKDIENNLYTSGLPDPDLIIRTSGEIRLSNFLIWQSAYAELYFTDTLWPDFRGEDLEKALIEYDKRQRRFGG